MTGEERAANYEAARVAAIQRDTQDRAPRHFTGSGLVTEQTPAMRRFSTLVLGWRGLLRDEA